MWIHVRNRPAALERVLPKATADERETLPAGAARLSQPLFEPKAHVVPAPEGSLAFGRHIASAPEGSTQQGNPILRSWEDGHVGPSSHGSRVRAVVG